MQDENQRLQSIIDEIKEHVIGHIEAIENNDEFDRGWNSAFKCMLHNIKRIEGELK